MKENGMKLGEKKLFNFAFFTDVWVCCKNVKKKKKFGGRF